MANNLVVQLLLKTGTFSSDLKTARGQIQNFQQGCQTAGKSLTGFGQSLGINLGALTKFGGAVGAATLAGKELKNILDSTQSTADAFEGAIAGCKGVVDQFRTSIATVDFSSFRNGLWQVFKDARNLRDALDQLGNTQIAFDYKSKENQTKFNEALNKFKKPKATDEEKEEAKRLMQEAVDAQKTFAANYSSVIYKAYVAQVVKEAGSANLSPGRITTGQFRKAMDIDLGLYGDPGQARANIEGQYEDYLKKLKEHGGNNITGQDELKRKYADVIAIRAMLQLMSDGELKNVSQMLGTMENAKNVALTMERTMNEAVKPFVEGGGATGIPAVTKYRDALVKDTEEWKQHNDKVVEAEKEIKKIRGEEEKRDDIMKNSYSYYSNLVSDLKQQREATNMDIDPQKWNELNSQLTEAEEKLSALDYISNNIDLNRYISVEPPTISSLQKVVSILKEIRNDTPITYEYFEDLNDMIKFYEDKLNQSMGLEMKEPNTNAWDEFNSAMADTSTIVNSLTNTFKENSKVTAASILQMVSTTLPAIGSLISSISALTAAEAVEAGVAATGKAVSTSKHWIEAISAVAALGAVVAAAISAANKTNIQRFANGGIVGGSSFTGDRVSAQVNSGEMILNKSQQANLFRIANGGSAGGKEVTFHISGTDLVGVMNNVNRKNKMIR